MLYPIIGITLDQDDQKFFINHDYVQAVIQAGGIPLLIPFLRDPIMIQKMVEQCSGLLLTGGKDVDPFYYGEEPSPNLGEIIPERDEIELKVFELFLQQNKPILAICRGCQLMNIALGGDLYQDIASQISSALNHDQHAPRGYPTHTIDIKKESLLFDIIGEKKIRVNSYHHQSVKNVCPPLTISAVASDGVVEAVESISHPFLLGVQWHPEGMSVLQDKHAMQLFSSFINACDLVEKNY
ncbi:gamma-glutamyl-gamma-aminobutyrate hydrolase family protein [Shimazuella sp. AN120528]|uniref:gamma-glutamyl-gamma-aminobutyrate hydrolase family protein n=1 Tax=Shimazuella soli TaxID=1892854 RepID=UPI001F101BBE|nr:gamma-glutamyl-gamma-aminobutyrate hydrolase family protein [Shimazuella soli]MCH5583924.1 gamma-glutamyl-gamma-aminobutyrate hydrolase family protein [Shimazuella soli]